MDSNDHISLIHEELQTAEQSCLEIPTEACVLDITNANLVLTRASMLKNPKQLFDSLWYEEEIGCLFIDSNVGESIKTVLKSQGRIARWLAEQIPCERTNVYKIFRRPDIDTDLLQRICVILGHDIFKDISDETFGSDVPSSKEEIDDEEE